MFKNQMSQDCWSISAPLICRIKNSEHNQNPIKLYFLLNISYFCQAEMKTSFWQFTFLQTILSSLFPGGSVVQNLPAVQEMQAQFLGQEDPLEKRMATHSIILAWRIPWMEEFGGLQSLGSQRVGHVISLISFLWLWPARFLHPWDSPGKNIGVGSHPLLQGIFLTQELNLGLLHWGQILYQLSYKESSFSALFHTLFLKIHF